MSVYHKVKLVGDHWTTTDGRKYTKMCGNTIGSFSWDINPDAIRHQLHTTQLKIQIHIILLIMDNYYRRCHEKFKDSRNSRCSYQTN